MKKILCRLILAMSLMSGANAHAGVPVVDGLGNGLMGVMQGIQSAMNTVTGFISDTTKAIKDTEWVQQLGEMARTVTNTKDTVTNLQTQIDDATGMTEFGTYVPDLTSNRKYLPDDYKTAEPTGMQDFIEDIAPASVTAMINGDLLERDKKQAAINRALGELAYKQASNRFSDLQSLVDKAGSSSLDKPKERENLMARIQAEQLMLQNEQIKLASIAIAQQAEAQLVREKKKQLILKSLGY